jgi:hypothetical protein
VASPVYTEAKAEWEGNISILPILHGYKEMPFPTETVGKDA